MHDPIATSRRALARAVAPPAVVVVLVAAAFLAKGGTWSLGALAGGGAVVIGGWLSARLALGGGIGPAAGALFRILGGVLAKWAVVLGVLVAAVVVAGWPPVAVLAGVVAALTSQVIALARRGTHYSS